MPALKIDPEIVRKLYVDDKKSTVEIASILDVSTAGVMQCLRRNGVQLRTRAQAHEKDTLRVFGFLPTREWLLQAMDRFGGNAAAVSEHFGISYPTLVDHLKKYGIERLSAKDRRNVGAPRVEIPIEEATQLSSQGVPYTELAEKYGVSYGIIMRRMTEAGHTSPRNKHLKHQNFRTVSYHKRLVLNEIGITACEICGEMRALDFCHIKAEKDGGPISKVNCLILCATHHRCFDNGTLTKEEFLLVKHKVRLAESELQFVYPHYKDW